MVAVARGARTGVEDRDSSVTQSSQMSKSQIAHDQRHSPSRRFFLHSPSQNRVVQRLRQRDSS
jgi:hypothetical protein